MKIVIYGVKYTAKIIAEILNESKAFEIVGFLGNKNEKKDLLNKRIYEDISFIGDNSLIPKLSLNGIDGFIIGVGNLSLREKLYYEFQNYGLKPISAISKHSIISPLAKLGRGVTVGHGTIISANVKIDDNTFIGNNSIIEVSSNISKNCTIGSKVLISTEAEIKKNVSIGSTTAVLNSVVVGEFNNISPGKILKKNIIKKKRMNAYKS